MTGEGLFDYYFDHDPDYANTLMMASLRCSTDEFNALLEESQRTGKRISIRHSDPDTLSEPDVVELISVDFETLLNKCFDLNSLYFQDECHSQGFRLGTYNDTQIVFYGIHYLRLDEFREELNSTGVSFELKVEHVDPVDQVRKVTITLKSSHDFQEVPSLTGQQLFDRYQLSPGNSVLGSPERVYAQTLRTAYSVVGSQRLFAALEEAERTGQRIELTYPIPFDKGFSYPCGIV